MNRASALHHAAYELIIETNDHLTLTGRRTNAYPHMAPAFDDMEQDFMERVGKYVGDAL